MGFRWRSLLAVLFVGVSFGTHAQTSVCPPNISFENGSFTGWQAFQGTVLDVGVVNRLTLNPSQSTANVHAILNRVSNPGRDPFGNFPLVAPNGGNYSIRLGNSSTGARAEQISYTLRVPADQKDFSLTYYYAVVFQDPSHRDYHQPRFTARVFDVAANKYLPCASFEYISTSRLPGFQKSAVGNNVFYKDWSPVTINLSGYAGKEIKLEFTTADCTEGGHFGYAYIDISNECSKSITGNTYCGQPASITLTGPGGYEKYNWYNADMTKLLGTGEVVTLSLVPAINEKITLQVIPYADFGCIDTLSTVIKRFEPSVLVTNPAPICAPFTVDLTAASVTAGSEASLTYTYWTDAEATKRLTNPSKVGISGKYYIKGQTSMGCFTIVPVTVEIYDQPVLNLRERIAAYAPNSIDITSAAISPQPRLSYRFSYDNEGKNLIRDLKDVSSTGTYYVTATNEMGCEITKAIPVLIAPVPKVFVPTGFTPSLQVNNRLLPYTAGGEAAAEL